MVPILLSADGEFVVALLCIIAYPAFFLSLAFLLDKYIKKGKEKESLKVKISEQQQDLYNLELKQKQKMLELELQKKQADLDLQIKLNQYDYFGKEETK